MKSPELKLFRAIITQAIDDAMYDGLYKYKIEDRLCARMQTPCTVAYDAKQNFSVTRRSCSSAQIT